MIPVMCVPKRVGLLRCRMYGVCTLYAGKKMVRERNMCQNAALHQMFAEFKNRLLHSIMWSPVECKSVGK